MDYAKYAWCKNSDGGNKGRRLLVTQQSEAIRREVHEWLDRMFSSKKFGSFAVEIKMHDGKPVAVEKSERVIYSGRDE